MSTSRHSTRRGRALSAIALASGAALLLAACSPGTDSGTSTGEASDLEAALAEGGELTYWTWTPSGEAQAEAFMEEYPEVDVTVVNAGTATDEYTALQNAITAGSGAPDVAQIEYYALQQFVLSDALLDLSAYGLDSLESDYTASTWAAVNADGGLYGLPQDSGPMVMLYNQSVFDEFGIDVPATWDEYIDAATTLNAADPTKFITNDAGDPGFADPLIWQAGGQPFQSDGTDITIDLQDEGSRQWADTWNRLLEPGLLSDIPTWSDDWFTALGNDTIATLITGAWMPGILEGSVPDGAGDWRVAPLPSYDGSPATAENGGSAQSVIQQTDNPALAAAFVQWLNNSDTSINVFLESGGFPSTTAQLNDEEYLNATPEYFGGQEINKVLVSASENVIEGFEYLPYQVYANSIFADTVGQAYLNGTDLNAGLEAWQENLVEYGNSQGFAVNE